MLKSDTTAISSLAGLSILLVEDDPILAEGLMRPLADASADVTWAQTLGATELHLRRAHWNVVLVDQWLPDGDGTSALATINRLKPRPAVVAMSVDLKDAKRVLRLQSAGAVLLPKPFLSEDLFTAIERARADTTTADLRTADLRESVPPASPRDVVEEVAPSTSLRFGPIAIELVSQTVTVDGVRVDLQPTQLRMLAQMLAKPGRVLSVQELIDGAFRGAHQDGGGNVRYQIHALRRRLGSSGKLIATHHGGYGIGLETATSSSWPPPSGPS